MSTGCGIGVKPGLFDVKPGLAMATAAGFRLVGTGFAFFISGFFTGSLN